MITLRNYQLEAIEKTSAMLAKVQRPLIVAPTSAGKSIIIGGICERAVTRGRRVLALCHQSEILAQNESLLNSMNPKVSTGIFCAGSGRKDTEGQVIFASRDSLGVNPTALGKFDLIIVDEAHLVSSNKETRYQKIFEAVGAKWIVGLTGTPWRGDNGKIWGPDKFFEAISYNISLDFLIQSGFICPYVFPEVQSLIDTTGLKVSRATGDYDERELEKLSATEKVVHASLDQWEHFAADRKCSIFFCCSIAHAELVTKHLVKRLGAEAVGYIDGKTKDDDREFLIAKARAGGFKALVNVGVLTTGVDIKPIDCVVGLRATRSAALFVQSYGRGLRVHPGKENLLCLDLAGNFTRFHSLSEPFATDKAKRKSEPLELLDNTPMKECPSCGFELHVGAKTCSYCGHVFISHTTEVHTSTGPKDGVYRVLEYKYEYSKTKGGHDCVITTFHLEGLRRPVKEWLLYKREDGLGHFHRNKVNILTHNKVTEVTVTDVTSNFPKLKYSKLEKWTKVEAGESQS